MNARRGVKKGRKKEKKELTKGRRFDKIIKRSRERAPRESSELLKEGGLAKAKSAEKAAGRKNGQAAKKVLTKRRKCGKIQNALLLRGNGP